MEGKEVRFGIADSALFATVTTARLVRRRQRDARLASRRSAASSRCGSCSSARSSSAASAPGCTACSCSPIIAVFVAGLMVGRTPEYLGKKIEAYEMKMASLVVLVPPATVLIVHRDRGRDRGRAEGGRQPRAARLQRDPLRVLVGREQQRQRVRRASRANTPFYNTTLGLAMFFGRFCVKVPVLALAGLAREEEDRPDDARARCRRTRRSSSRCSSASSSSSAR